MEHRGMRVNVWFICALGVTGCASRGVAPPGSAASSPVTTAVAHAVAADVAYAQSAADVVRHATLIIVGMPTDRTEEISRSSDGAFVHYSQAIRVDEVLKGHVAGGTIKLVRSALVQQGHTVVTADIVLGPLSPEEHVLFLQPSAAPDVFQIVGYTSGALRLDEHGRTTAVRPEVTALENLSVAELRETITALSQP